MVTKASILLLYFHKPIQFQVSYLPYPEEIDYQFSHKACAILNI